MRQYLKNVLLGLVTAGFLSGGVLFFGLSVEHIDVLIGLLVASFVAGCFGPARDFLVGYVVFFVLAECALIGVTSLYPQLTAPRFAILGVSMLMCYLAANVISAGIGALLSAIARLTWRTIKRH